LEGVEAPAGILRILCEGDQIKPLADRFASAWGPSTKPLQVAGNGRLSELQVTHNVS